MVLGLFLLLLMIPVFLHYALEFEYRHDGLQEDVIRICIWVGPLKIPIRLDVIRWVGSKLTTHVEVGHKETDIDITAGIPWRSLWERVTSGLKGYQLYIVRKLLGEIHTFDWRVVMSTGEPHLTALLAGAAWSILGPVFAYLNMNHHFLNPPRVKIYPSYGKPMVKTEFHCIFRIRLGHIISESICDLYRYVTKQFGRKGMKI